MRVRACELLRLCVSSDADASDPLSYREPIPFYSLKIWLYKSESKRESVRALPSLVVAHAVRYGMAAAVIPVHML